MPMRALLPFLAVLLLLLGAAAAWWAAHTGHAAMLGHLNAIAPDGDVESYTAAFHHRVQANLRMAAIFLALAAAACTVLAVRMRRVPAGAWARFRSDLRETAARYAKRTSPAHKRHVLLLIAVGTALRIWMMCAPITYDEAFTWTYYASRPLHVVLCEYAYPNNHIFHTLWVKLSTLLFTPGLFSLRLPALVAAILFMPAFYLFVRATFNRYIAVLALALVAASPVLVEYGALARGYSITWLCMAMALLLGRHLLKEGGRTSAVLLGLVLAIGTWTVPTMVYPALMVLAWLAVHLLARHGTRGMAAQAGGLVVAAGVWLAVSALLYLPVLAVYGSGHLLDHPVLERPDRATFFRTLGERLLSVHAHLAGGNWAATRIIALVLCIVAGHHSGRYRALLFAAFCGSVPLMLLQGQVAPGRVWLYLVPFAHLGVAIGLFYLLKAVQEKMLPGWGKRRRVMQASVVLVPIVAWPLSGPLPEDAVRSPEAREAAAYLHRAMDPGDRAYTRFPWDAPIEFHAVAEGMDRALFHRPPVPGGMRFVAVGRDQGQTVAGVLMHHRADTTGAHRAELVVDLPRLGIFAVR